MRYLISGYYGEKNAGDEAILAGILQEIERRDPEASFVVLSFDPEDTEARHAQGRDLVAIPSSLRLQRSLRLVMKGCDLLISGGGSFLHEADFALYGRSFLFREGKLRPVPYFLTIVLLARSVGLPVMWYAQGLGPLHTWAARRLVAVAASVSQVVTWRDRDSALLAAEIGVRPPVQLVVPDPAYGLDPAVAGEADRVLAEAGLALEGARGSRPRFLAACPRPWLGRTGFLEALGEVLEEVAAHLDLDVLLVPFHEIQDPVVCQGLAARPAVAGRAHVLPPQPNPTVLAAVLGQAEFALTMRLHSGILAAVAGTPAVILDYDPKTRAFAQQTRQTAWAISVDDLEDKACRSKAKAALLEAIRQTAYNLTERRRQLERVVAPLRAEAGRTSALAVQLAAGGFAPYSRLAAGGAATSRSGAWPAGAPLEGSPGGPSAPPGPRQP